MRKHNKSNSIKSIGRRGAAWLLALALMCGLMPGAGLSALAVQAPGTGNQAEYGHWAQEYLDKLVSWGVMRGDIDGNLRPDADISRAEFVTMVNRAYGYDEVGVNPFTDVDFHSWYADDISIAYNVGYFTGTSSTTASPDLGLTREQATLLLGRNMMLEASTGETLGYADSREFSDWSRAMIPAASNAGIINGYSDGTFRPQNNITRGEVAAMLARSLGTPIYEAGEYELGNVYGNVTIATSGVNLRNTVIAGDLYLTGGIGLGELLLENVTVLGRIIASGAGESNKGDSSIILRNVEADSMVVDSINNQFVTLRVEGDTDIDVTSVRTPAYLEDVTPDEYGLKLVQLEGEAGTSLQLAGNVKEVVNLTPNSYLHMAQGSAQRVTIDEKAMGATMQIDLGARVKELNLDVATTVTGTGDVDHVNISAAGCTVAMPPDTVDIRPGISSSVAGEAMDNVTAAEYSADPRILAGYPEARNVAPTGADAVFSTNKRGTVYWAITALADGSVSEDDLITPPVYGGIILQSGTLQAAASKTEYTAKLNKLTTDGSYYLSAIMVDSRGQHSPVKVTAFTTPDDTVPAFTTGYPVMSSVKKDEAQVTVMTNKSCRLYYAVLPQGSTAPKPEDFKANAITGNLGYGTRDEIKNSTDPFKVNSLPLEEQKTYDLYLWLTDYDGAKSSAVRKISFTTVDGTPPIFVTDPTPIKIQEKQVSLSASINEAGTIFWAVVPEGTEYPKALAGQTEKPGLDSPAAKIQVENGINALKFGRVTAAANKETTFNVTGLEGESAYDLYYMAQDRAGNYSEWIKVTTIHTLDTGAPTVELEFNKTNDTEGKVPMADSNVSIVFSENIRDVASEEMFLSLYRDSRDPKKTKEEQEAAKKLLADLLYQDMKLIDDDSYNKNEVPYLTKAEDKATATHWIDYGEATVTQDGGKLYVTFENGKAIKLNSGGKYYFLLNNISDTSDNKNKLRPADYKLPFHTVFATVNLTDKTADTKPVGASRVDMAFQFHPLSTGSVADTVFYDILLWSDKTIKYDIYCRVLDNNDRPVKNTNDPNMSLLGLKGVTYGTMDDNGWVKLNQPANGSTEENLGSITSNGTVRGADSVIRRIQGNSSLAIFPTLKSLTEGYSYEFAIEVKAIGGSMDYQEWSDRVELFVTIPAGSEGQVRALANSPTPASWDYYVPNYLTSVGNPESFKFSVFYQFTDLRTPSFSTGYPSFDPSDVSVDMNLQLNREGTIYYALAPVEETSTGSWLPYLPTIDKGNNVVIPIQKDPSDPNSKDIPPKSGADIANCPDLIAPTNMDIFLHNFTDTENIIFNQKTVGTARTVLTENNLKPGTIYYAYFVLKGVSQDLSQVYCFQFKTADIIRPVLNLEINEKDNSKVDASVDRTSEVYARLLVSSNIPSPFSDPFANHVDNKLVGNDTNKPWLDDKGGTNKNYTVLDAMINSVGTRGTRSVFDVYAKLETQNQIAEAIRSGTLDLISSWGPRQIKMDGTETMNFDLPDEDATYICVAVARSQSGEQFSQDAFRAVQPVRIVDRIGPKAESVSAMLSFDDYDTQRTVSGFVTVTYDKYLYRIFSGKAYPVTEDTSYGEPDGTTHKDYCGLAGLLGSSFITQYKVVGKQDETSYSPNRTMSITIQLTNFPVGGELSIPGVLCNKSSVLGGATKIRIVAKSGTVTAEIVK